MVVKRPFRPVANSMHHSLFVGYYEQDNCAIIIFVMSTFSSASLSFLLNSSILSPGLKLGSVLPVCACLNSISSSSNFALSFFSMASRFSEAFCNWSNDLKNIIFVSKSFFFSINLECFVQSIQPFTCFYLSSMYMYKYYLASTT